MSLAQWREMADTGSPTSLSLKPGLCWASELGVIEFDGPDAAKFLQGYLTCDTEALPPDQWLPTALCNLKGRVVANGWVGASASNSLFLLVHHSLTGLCLDFLHKYLVFAKAEGHNRSQELVVVLGLEAPKPTNQVAHDLVLDRQLAQAGTLQPDGEHPTLPWLAVLPTDQATQLWAQGLPIGSSTQLTSMLIRAQHALVSEGSSEQYLPQMLGLADRGAIDFDKGCYLGQEIVARAQHRGSVKRQLVQLQWQQPTDAWPGHELANQDNAALGNMINWLVAPEADGPSVGIALAVIKSSSDGLPTQVQSLAQDDSSNDTPVVFQVRKIEN